DAALLLLRLHELAHQPLRAERDETEGNLRCGQRAGQAADKQTDASDHRAGVGRSREEEEERSGDEKQLLHGCLPTAKGRTALVSGSVPAMCGMGPINR